MIMVAFALSVLSCEVLDNDIQKHTDKEGNIYVGLDEVAEVLSDLPLNLSHMHEVYDAVTSSSDNGYDEEYMMQILFESPGKGVGDIQTRASVAYSEPLRKLIESYVRAGVQTKSGGKVYSADDFLNALTTSDIQIYWPYSENWDGSTLPVITFDPEDGSEVNIGYRLFINDDGSRRVESVEVDEAMAIKSPVWVVNRNSDAEFTTLEMLRREDPEWGEGGGTIIVKSGTKTGEDPLKTLVLKEFKMNRQFDSWFSGAAEVFVKTGSVDDFTASTEAELRLFNPMVTDFMIVVKRSKVGQTIPFNAVLVSDWNPQMTHCALMITEDDGGTRTEWKCTALVRIASKSYGVEINLPFNSRDDIVWRGHLTNRWLEANSNIVGHFGDVDLTFEVVEY
jgi:hypothetical protein